MIAHHALALVAQSAQDVEAQGHTVQASSPNSVQASSSNSVQAQPRGVTVAEMVYNAEAAAHSQHVCYM